MGKVGQKLDAKGRPEGSQGNPKKIAKPGGEMKTCGDCPWKGYDGCETVDGEECRSRRAFRVVRDHCRELKSELAQVKGAYADLEQGFIGATEWARKLREELDKYEEAKP